MAELRSDVLVRMPAELKRRLAGEVERRRASLNDVAVAILASRFASPVRAERPPRRAAAPGGGDVLLRMPRELKERLARRAGERRKTTHDLIVETLSEGLGRQRKEAMSAERQRQLERARTRERQGARRDHRRRQLRQLAAAGGRVLPRRAATTSSSPG